MQKLKKIFSCVFSIFSSNHIHNNKDDLNRDKTMNEQNLDFNEDEIQTAISSLSDKYNISSRYLLASANARTPAVLNGSYKRAYKDVGISDKNNILTPFGEAVFKHIDDEHAKTGRPKPVDLPQVASSLSYD